MDSRWILLIGIVGLIALMGLAYVAVQLEDDRLPRAPQSAQVSSMPANSTTSDSGLVGVPLLVESPEPVSAPPPSGPQAEAGPVPPTPSPAIAPERSAESTPKRPESAPAAEAASGANSSGSAELSALASLLQTAYRGFEPRRAVLGPQVVEPLKEAASQLITWRKPIVLEVEAPSEQLAQERAWALRDYLVIRGVDPALVRYIYRRGPDRIQIKMAS
jgi:hypothetical protein|nr:MAG: hypothetical protein KatS3mg041_0303 [Bacteroidota bacterium]